jgi:hypothetical protein
LIKFWRKPNRLVHLYQSALPLHHIKTPHTLSVFTNLKQLHFFNIISFFSKSCRWTVLHDPAAVVILSVPWTIPLVINSDHRICSLAAANELIWFVVIP